MNNQAAQTMPGDLRWKIDTLRPSSSGVVSLTQEEWAYVAAALSQTAEVADGPLSGKYGDVLRPFVIQMERELHANAGKGDRPGWLKMSPEVALLEIYYHLAKLQKAVKDDNGPCIQEYAADVANMSMMLLDICGGLALIEYAAPAASGGEYPECSGDPASCPENEGHGCCKPNPKCSCPSGDGSLDWPCKAHTPSAASESYAKANPLGGPATMFDAIANRLRAGEPMAEVLEDYGLRFVDTAAASVSERARECPACKGAGEVMQPVWTPDPQDGYDALGTCPRCGGNGSTFPKALQDLLYFTEHCLSAADEGVDYSTSREWLDAMTTMGVMKKTGRGKWAPSDQAQPVADALRALEQALTQQRGECIYQFRCTDGGWIETDKETYDMEPIGIERRIVYTTPQPSADAVRELVQRWRDDLKYEDEITAKAHGKFADELESLLGRGA